PPNGAVAFVVSVGVLIILATGTRAALFGLGAVLMATMVVARGRRLRLVFIIGSIAVSGLVVAMAPALVDYVAASLRLEQSTPENANVLGRLDVSHGLLDHFGRNPILGLGPGVV